MKRLDLEINDNGHALQKAVWLLIAVALNAAELAVPRLPFLPWLKPGLANVITVLWIIKYGCRDAFLYTALRIWISGFYFGFSLFTFSLSLCGGLLSTAAMSVMWLTLGKRGWLGTIGMAVVGALFHNAGQLAAVYLMMARNIGVLGQIPFMLGASVVFGGIVGGIVPVVARGVGFYDYDGDGGYPRNAPPKTDNAKSDMLKPNYGGKIFHKGKFLTLTSTDTFRLIDVSIVTMTFAVSVMLMFIDDIKVLITAAMIFSFITLILTKRAGGIFYPLKFYMLFLFVAATHLFFTYGTRLDFLPFATKEGAVAFVKQSLRLWCWLQTAHIFRRFKFREIFIGALYRFFPNKKETLEAGMIALEHFPEMIRFAKSRKKIPVAAILFKPASVLSEYVAEARERIAAAVGGEEILGVRDNPNQTSP